MKGKWFYPGCLAVLMLVLALIGFMDMLGYKLIEPAVSSVLLGVLVTMALGGGAIWITRKMKKGGLKILVGTACVLLVSAAVLVMFTFFIFYNNFYSTGHYATLRSESGREIAVMRRISQKYAFERAADNPDSSLQMEDLGYDYTIYPVFSKFFYNSKQPGKGELEIGCGSAAQLMHEWDGDSLRMFIRDAEEFDSGELFLP